MSLPYELRRSPFTTKTALAAGISPDVLRGPRCRRLFRGVYVSPDVELTYEVWLRAALLVLPKDSLVSHRSALPLYGFHIPRRGPLEFSTNSSLVTQHDGIRLHRRQGRLSAYERSGLPVTGPDRTFVDCATRLSLVQLVQLGDWLIHMGATSHGALAEYCLERHLAGVRRARRAVAHLCTGAESPMETHLRLMLVFARLPHPLCNADIVDSSGTFLARGDLVYPEFKVLVEYDGRHHESDPWQRQRDRVRREQLEGAGWRVIIVTVEDLRHSREIPYRVFRALEARGYSGPRPVLSSMWSAWFERPSF